MIKRILILLVLAMPLVLLAAAPNATQGNWVYLQSGSNLRISIETYKTQKGWTPVIVSVAGAEVSAVMDSQGRVVHFVPGPEASTVMGGKGRGAHASAKGLDIPILPLFTIEIQKGRILLGRESHAIRVYEQNGVRTRLVIAESAIALPLVLDRQGKAGTLRLGGLQIPARVSVVNPMRTTINKFSPQTSVAAQSLIQKGHYAEAQLTPSRIRARGK
jgi:hypothetical protein